MVKGIKAGYKAEIKVSYEIIYIMDKGTEAGYKAETKVSYNITYYGKGHRDWL